uniref:Uncharacterized protein n=1 Tax=Salmo trutta TaxID=8032 RepID=A0A674CA45_SALTR
MHLTRPKSSKGRCRPSLSHTPNVDVAASFHDTPMIPKPPSMGYNRSDRCLLPTITANNVPELPSLPFPWNKYKPLPSIEKKASEECVFEWCGGEEIQAQSVRQPTVLSEDPSPCGRRFEHHFLPTDTLLQRPDMDPDISMVTNKSLFVTERQNNNKNIQKNACQKCYNLICILMREISI